MIELQTLRFLRLLHEMTSRTRSLARAIAAFMFAFAMCTAASHAAAPWRHEPLLPVRPPDEVLTLWSSQRRPSAGEARVHGSTTGGCVEGAVALPRRGEGYWAVRPNRATHFGHANLVDYVQTLGRRVSDDGLPALAIGDMSLPRGGPYPQQHRSHQNGLDVDIYFWRLDDRPIRPPLRSPRWALPAPPRPAGPWRPERIRPQRVRLLQLAAEDPRVDAILVNPRIKAALCKLVQGDRDWLSRVQPFWGHERHFHVRMHCPADSPGCAEKELPTPQMSGDGCGSSLAWWFTPAARDGYMDLVARDLASRGRNLPPACEALPERGI